MRPVVNWNAYIDAYCERTSPAFWSEPLNAVTNAFFLLAALWLAWRLLQQLREKPGRAPWSLLALVVLIGVIGVGSFLFHTFATRWALLADTTPIQFFILWYMACFLHWMLGLRWRYAWLGVPGFYLFAMLIGKLVPPSLWNGSASYLPALLSLLSFALLLFALKRAGAAAYLLTAAVFTCSFTLRSIDMAVCNQWPWGTHFLWHTLNALTLYLATAILIDAWKRRATG